jgi:CheY-like chemotaxis protein
VSAGDQHILVIEDNQADVFVIQDAIRASGIEAHVRVVNNGEDAIRFLDSAETPCPGLVILDLNLPKIRGNEVLHHLRQGRCSDTPVIIASTSGMLQDRQLATTAGASLYFRKPSRYDEFMKLADLIRDIFTSTSR